MLLRQANTNVSSIPNHLVWSYSRLRRLPGTRDLRRTVYLERMSFAVSMRQMKYGTRHAHVVFAPPSWVLQRKGTQAKSRVTLNRLKARYRTCSFSETQRTSTISHLEHPSPTSSAVQLDYPERCFSEPVRRFGKREHCDLDAVLVDIIGDWDHISIRVSSHTYMDMGTHLSSDCESKSLLIPDNQDLRQSYLSESERQTGPDCFPVVDRASMMPTDPEWRTVTCVHMLANPLDHGLRSILTERIECRYTGWGCIPTHLK